jgi:hypothetical protein
MVGFTKTIVGLAATCMLSTFVNGHPGHDPTQEIRERSEYLATLENADIAHCAPKLAKRGDMDKTVERRQAMLRKLRRQKGIDVDGMWKRNVKMRTMD